MLRLAVGAESMEDVAVLLRYALILVLFGFTLARGAVPEAMLVSVGDQHSAYERLPQWVAHIDALRRENPGVPLAIIVDGDAFEYSNVLARRSAGEPDFALFAALVHRAPTVLNLGNHEPDLLAMADVVRRLRAVGVIIISGNARDRATGQPFAPAATKLMLGAHELTVVGITTDNLATYRVPVRATVDLAAPVDWARRNLGGLLRGAALPVLVSHAGLKADRQLLAAVPDGTLFIGAHDHLQLVHQSGNTVYFHSGSWLSCFTIARLQRTENGLRWTVEQKPIRAGDAADPEMATVVKRASDKYLTPDDTAVVGRLKVALDPREAALYAVAAVRSATAADVAVIGATTFGGGLPGGTVTRYAFDNCVRFDGPLFAGEITGAQLQQLTARANQGPETPFDERSGENLVLVGPAAIQPQRRYRLVTSDWIARKPQDYLGANAPALTQLPDATLKGCVLQALQQ